jgi:hypothetical protein
MADDLTLDEGTGSKKAATDEVAANRHVPWVKLASGGDDETYGALVDASGNLQVETTNPSIAGTAGTPNAGVLSVQGIASATPVIVQGLQSARNTGNLTSGSTTLGPWDASEYNIATVVLSGTYNSVTAVFEGSDDGGTTWVGIQGVRTAEFVAESGFSLLTNTTRAWDIPIGAFTHFRVRSTAWTSGTAVIGCTFQSFAYEPSPTAGIVQSVGGSIQWSNYSYEYTAAQTSTDLVAATAGQRIYVGRITLSTGYVASASLLVAKVYFGTGAYANGSKIVAAMEAATIPGTGLQAYPGLVIGNGAAPFTISAVADALKITTTATTHPRVYVSVDYVKV